MNARVYNRISPGYSALNGFDLNTSVDINSWSANSLFLQKSTRRSDAEIVDPKGESIKPYVGRNYGNFRPASASNSNITKSNSVTTPLVSENDEAARIPYGPAPENPQVKYGFDEHGNGQYYLSNETRGTIGTPNLNSVSEPQASLALSGEALEASEVGSDLGKASSFMSNLDMGPAVVLGSMVDQSYFNSVSNADMMKGTIAGRIQASNATREGNYSSTGIIAGGTIGSLFDEELGPLGTIAGAAIGGAIGGLISTSQDRSINTTVSSTSANDVNEAF